MSKVRNSATAAREFQTKTEGEVGMISLDDMEYRNDDGDEYYKGFLDNGDIILINKYAASWRNNPSDTWDWRVCVPDEYPVSYARRHHSRTCPTEQAAIDDFCQHYRGRSWRTHAEYVAEHGPTYYRCLGCGWEGEGGEIDNVTVYEDYGDVSCAKCPGCGRIEYDGMKLLEERS